MPVTVIRSFQNADLPSLHRLWMEHWSTFGPPPAVREAQFEQAVPARTFFQADQLLVAEADSQPCAWLQFSASPEDASIIVIPAVCLGDASELSHATALLDEAQRRGNCMGGKQFEVGVVRDRLFGYAGLDPIGHGCGVSAADTRSQQALESAAYRPRARAVSMSASVAGVRPPVNREALQLRRSAKVLTAPVRYPDPRHASSMSHLDVETSRLVDRDGKELARMDAWYSDPEAEVMSPTRMIVDLGQADQDGGLKAAGTFLLGAMMQTAAERNILTAESVVDENQQELLRELEKLQFQPESRGVRWERTV